MYFTFVRLTIIYDDEMVTIHVDEFLLRNFQFIIVY